MDWHRGQLWLAPGGCEVAGTAFRATARTRAAGSVREDRSCPKAASMQVGAGVGSSGDLGAVGAKPYYCFKSTDVRLLANACQTFVISRQCEGNVVGLIAVSSCG